MWKHVPQAIVQDFYEPSSSSITTYTLVEKKEKMNVIASWRILVELIIGEIDEQLAKTSLSRDVVL
jgi:hypothetical protein